MNKQQKLSRIIQSLLDQGKAQFTRLEIEKAITKVLWVVDQRSLDNWFELMWKLEFFTQPNYDCFKINFTEIERLDVEVKDEKQERLDVNL